MPTLGVAGLAAKLVPRDPLMRKLTVIRLSDSVGRGVFMSGSVLYFTLHVGLSARIVGLGLSTAALSALVSVVVFGVIADRVGKRRLLSILFAVWAVLFALYTQVHGAAWFFPLVAVAAFVEGGIGPTDDALTVTLVPPDQMVGLKAMMRTVFNVGFSIGIGISALCATTKPTLVVIPIAAAILMAGTSVLVTRLPEGRKAAEAPQGFRAFTAVRDHAYLKVVGVSAILALHASIVLAVLPLWALNRTTVPHPVVPALMIFNTAFVILFQVRASRGVDDVPSAGRAARRSGLWLATGCLVAGVTAFGGVSGHGLAVAGFLIVAILLFSVAEVMQAASGWSLAFGLAPEHAQGEYLGTFELHVISQNVVGPAALSGLVLSYGFWGWAGIALVVLAGTALIVPVSLAAERAMRARAAAAEAGTESSAVRTEVAPAGG
jgi:MFS family permease